VNKISTTFEVYPTTTEIPTLVELLKVANQKINQILRPFELQEVPLIYVRLGEKIISPSDSNSESVKWDEEYAWFYIEPSEGGGTDAYFHKVDELVLDIWDDYGDYGDMYLEVKNSLSVGYYWSFRRSAGQPAIINLAYGVIASALAELTQGYLFSDDGAWRGGPIRPNDFNSQYFVPSNAKSFGDASWYERCLDDIVSEYSGKPFELQYQMFEEHELSREQRLVYYPSGRLFREGPAANDRLFVMLSMFDKFPYFFIDHKMISTTEETLIRQLKQIDIKEGYRFFNNSIERVLEEHKRINLYIDRHDITFWVNSLCIKDGEAIKKQIT
jgi:hypothetical protein